MQIGFDDTVHTRFPSTYWKERTMRRETDREFLAVTTNLGHTKALRVVAAPWSDLRKDYRGRYGQSRIYKEDKIRRVKAPWKKYKCFKSGN
jgi:hypothetical protein